MPRLPKPSPRGVSVPLAVALSGVLMGAVGCSGGADEPADSGDAAAPTTTAARAGDGELPAETVPADFCGRLEAEATTLNAILVPTPDDAALLVELADAAPDEIAESFATFAEAMAAVASDGDADLEDLEAQFEVSAWAAEECGVLLYDQVAEDGAGAVEDASGGSEDGLLATLEATEPELAAVVDPDAVALRETVGSVRWRVGVLPTANRDDAVAICEAVAAYSESAGAPGVVVIIEDRNGATLVEHPLDGTCTTS